VCEQIKKPKDQRKVN